MGLYHCDPSKSWTRRAGWVWRLCALAALLISAACAAPQSTQALIRVQISADGQTLETTLPAGSTVQQALDAGRISLGELDRVDPPSYTLLSDGAAIRVVRVREEFTIEQVVIPFERQVLQTESLPANAQLLAQRGANGLREVTYRHVYEDDVEITDQPAPIKTVDVKKPVAEVVMVGVQMPFTPFDIPGRMVYLLGNNAWVIEGSTANRRPLVTTGDLDGRVFTLSRDGNWLLFTRRADEEGLINTLWALQLDLEGAQPVSLRTRNIVHFADWVPKTSNSKVVYSSVEPRAAAPGWQANNDLNYVTIYKSGAGNPETVKFLGDVGGQYGWWGATFLWNPDGSSLAFSNPSSVGWVGGTKEETPVTLLEFDPLLTRSDWAWVPGLTWAPDGALLFTVRHDAPLGTVGSQKFDLVAIAVGGGPPVPLAQDVGMFAYPASSPLQPVAGELNAFQIAYLRARLPSQSISSKYDLMVMDRDGSNNRRLFPGEGRPGVEPQQVVWSPRPINSEGEFGIALLDGGNLWLVNAVTGEMRQITGDGLVSRIIWRAVSAP